MTIGPIGPAKDRFDKIQKEMPKKPADSTNEKNHDSVEISGNQPHGLMVGAPASRLAPMAYPVNVHPAPIALEITNGIGIGIDGESIIVGPGKEGEIEIIGHLEDGTYPQRDYNVKREGNKTVIDGYFDWQDYEITKDGDKMKIQGETTRESYDVEENGSKINIKGATYPVQTYEITSKGNETFVDGFETMNDAHLVTKGDVTEITGGFPERNFTVTRGKNHMKVDGKYAFQDFDITWDDKQIVVKGYYPHQKQVIKFKS